MAGPYAYKIAVNYNRLKVTKRVYAPFFELPLSVEKLRSFVGENEFWIGSDETGEAFIYWNETRDETDDEMQARIAKGENYNRQREKWIAERNAKTERKENGNTDKN